MSYAYKSTPFAHQAAEFEQTRTSPAWARLWEQGTGKTKPTIDEIAWLWAQRSINGVLIVAPSGVHSNWVNDEVPLHLPDEVREQSRFFIWRASQAHTKKFDAALFRFMKPGDLLWAAMSYDAFMTKKGKEFARRFLSLRRVFYVLDESIAIKTPGTKRTKSIVASGKHAEYRRILNGTPVTNAPFDIYTQMRFLKEDFWRDIGADDFSAFKTLFGVWDKGTIKYMDGKGELKTREYPVLVSYKNLDLLRKKILTLGSRVRKAEVTDLPPKLYTKRYFELTAEQRDLYMQLKAEFMAELEGGKLVTAALPIVRLLRFAQITSGYLPTPEDLEEPIYNIPGGNPRIELMEEVRDSIPGQALVWARFDRDIDQLMELFGDKAVRYDGKVGEVQRDRNKAAFKAGEFQWFVSKTAVGRAGLTLNEASTSIYYNNTFSLLDRQQSEDRNHRIGQTADKVLYIDIVAEGTVDVRILQALRSKYDVAAKVTGDQVKEWI